MVAFALNQVTTPNASFDAFVGLAARLGCVGIEARNDLCGPLFDGISPVQAGRQVRAAGLRLLGVSQVYPFNAWSPEIARETQELIGDAEASGAESINLIPRNDGRGTAPAERRDHLRRSLDNLLLLLEETSVVALIEPLGFASASLRIKAEVVAEIDAAGASGKVKLVHDTFHHTLAGDDQIAPAHTGIVHISGVDDPDTALLALEDTHRVTVGAHDRLGNIAQINALHGAGYDGVFSFECFAPEVHALDDPAPALQHSMDFITSQLQAKAA